MRDAANEIIDFVKANGAKEALLVGGCVRDQVLGVPSKDIDIEVYGLPLDNLMAVLSRRFRVKEVGVSFGIVKVVDTRGQEFDVAVPRRENKVGAGHRGFEVVADHNMTPIEAARRRDFTINAIMQDRLGNFIDPFDGIKDLKHPAGVHLVAVSEAFSEDPLRVLRGMQFASRFNATMDSATTVMCMRLLKQFHTLPKERVFEEWRKWAKGSFPSKGLNLLVYTQWIECFPMLKALIGCPQDPIWHPEGDVWTHNCHVCDAAAEIADREGLTGEAREELMFSALCHDLGKPETTDKTNKAGERLPLPNGKKFRLDIPIWNQFDNPNEYIEGYRWTAHGHADAGVPHAKAFLNLIGTFGPLLDTVPPLVAEHMAHSSLEGMDLTPRIVRRLAHRLHPASLQMWSRLVHADHNGRPPIPKATETPVANFLEVGKDQNVLSDRPQPILMGRHLLDIGLQPGPTIGKVCKAAFEKQLDGEFADVEGAIKWCRENNLLGV